MRRYGKVAIVAILLAAAGCGRQEAERAAGRAAAERGETVEPLEVRGYDPDTLAWFQEGRPVIFETRAWRPVGEPIVATPDAFRRVGDFEGMDLYAAAADEPPYETLFFPLGNDHWQPLEPNGGALSDAR